MIVNYELIPYIHVFYANNSSWTKLLENSAPQMWQSENELFIFFKQLMSFTFIPAFKETAFLLAVSSAALTHALAKACSSGRMERCTCDDSPGIQHREAWQWGVCGDNLKYSTKFLKKFLGQKRVSKDLRAQVDAHNINVGIRVSVNRLTQRSRVEILH